jgi:hypothetical protein
VTLIDRPGVPNTAFGCSLDNFNDIVLDDDGIGGTIESRCTTNLTSPPSYTPNNPLTTFIGENIAGHWELNVIDSSFGDTGTLVSWCLEWIVPCDSPVFGSLTGSSPIWDRINAANNVVDLNCHLASTASIFEGQFYVAVPIHTTVAENLEAEIVSPGTTLSDPVMGLYCDPFDAAHPGVNLVAFDFDDGAGGLSAFHLTDNIALVPNRRYWLVVSTFAAGDMGNFELCLSGHVTEIRDNDHDGILDDVDNCFAVGNHDQADADHDGIGDACDTCTDTDGDGYGDPGFPLNTCPLDGCPSDPAKIAPGICGCGIPDVDTDGDGVLDCNDGCPADPTKTAPGLCGCGTPDTDTDGDGVPDCLDNCPHVANADQADANGDGIGDACRTTGSNAANGSCGTCGNGTPAMLTLGSLMMLGIRGIRGRRRRITRNRK